MKHTLLYSDGHLCIFREISETGNSSRENSGSGPVYNWWFPTCQWIGLVGKIDRKTINFHGRIDGFRLRLSLKPIHWRWELGRSGLERNPHCPLNGEPLDSQQPGVQDYDQSYQPFWQFSSIQLSNFWAPNWGTLYCTKMAILKAHKWIYSKHTATLK